MSTSKIPVTLQSQRDEILQEWVREQLASETSRGDLLSEGELRVQSQRFIEVLASSLISGKTDIHQPEYAPVLELLSDLSRSRGRQGFSPAETASFVFSLKRPLFNAMRKSY